MRISDWSSDVCASDLRALEHSQRNVASAQARGRGGEVRAHTPCCAQRFLDTSARLLRRRQVAWDVGVRRRRTDESGQPRSEEHTSELQSLMRISYAVFCLKKKKNNRR